jgi:radical SAM superfamily enzyme YgiQ (UPF0313 family)
MKFALINPNRKIDKRNIWNVVNSITPPMGLAVLASVLEEAGHESDIIDAMALDIGVPDILSRIDDGADFIGITSTTVEIDSAAGIARAARRQFPGAKIIMGGVHPTIFHDELVGEGVCDMVIRGEGEEAVVALAGGKPLDAVPNLTWRTDEGEIRVNPQQDHYVDLDRLPFPAYDRLPMDRYHSALGAAKRSPSIGMITSRGCPGRCTFCYSGMHGRRLRLMSPERIVEHIIHLKTRYGIKEISFYDDTFTASSKRVERLCDLMLSEGLGLNWSCFARADSVRPGLLGLMKKAGCHQINFGFESADEEILKNIRKKVDIDSIGNAIAWTKSAGIDIRGSFMLGNPGETEESMLRTIEYSKKVGIQFAIYNITTPFPGTELFSQSMEGGLVKHTDWGLYDLAHPILALPTVSSDTVLDLYSRAYREFYFRPGYILKRILSIRNGYELMTHIKAGLGIVSTTFRDSKGDNA